MSDARLKSCPITPGESLATAATLPVSKVSSLSMRHSRTGSKRALSSELRYNVSPVMSELRIHATDASDHHGPVLEPVRDNVLRKSALHAVSRRKPLRCGIPQRLRLRPRHVLRGSFQCSPLRSHADCLATVLCGKACRGRLRLITTSPKYSGNAACCFCGKSHDMRYNSISCNLIHESFLLVRRELRDSQSRILPPTGRHRCPRRRTPPYSSCLVVQRARQSGHPPECELDSYKAQPARPCSQVEQARHRNPVSDEHPRPACQVAHRTKLPCPFHLL